MTAMCLILCSAAHSPDGFDGLQLELKRTSHFVSQQEAHCADGRPGQLCLSVLHVATICQEKLGKRQLKKQTFLSTLKKEQNKK